MLTIGSRGSKLALWQAQWVSAHLREMGEPSRVEIIKTTGDKITDVALSKVGGKGLFTKEIEEALLDGRIDLAVHSMKDLPTEVPRGLMICAVSEREDPRDAIAGSTMDGLGQRAMVGTSSLRRAAQLRALRPDLRIESIRGNVDTRLRKLDEGEYDAIVLASAGLRRLGLEDRIAEILPAEIMVPAVGQGALAIETREEDSAATRACRCLNHKATAAAVTAERSLLAGLGGGCQVPIGGYAQVSGDALTLSGIVIAPDGGSMLKGHRSGPAAEALRIGRELAQVLLEEGADAILEEVYGA